MDRFVDLSHAIEDGMPGFRLEEENGTVELSARVRPFRTHEAMAPYYADGVSFEITEVCFQTSVGTYLDAPYHRYQDRRDVSELALSEVIRPGVAVDAGGADPGAAVGPEVLPEADLADTAVLVCFGWDAHWGTDRYADHPFLSSAAIDALIERDVALVGVDARNVDDHTDPARPAHSRFLDADVLIVENLRNLDRLLGASFRFFAAPLAVRGAAAMPVRAFAAVEAADH